MGSREEGELVLEVFVKLGHLERTHWLARKDRGAGSGASAGFGHHRRLATAMSACEHHEHKRLLATR